MSLRPYQQDAVDALFQHLLEKKTNPALILPTGAGKTHVISEACVRSREWWGIRSAVIAPSKELLVQTEEKLIAADPSIDIGLYCASLGRKEAGRSVTLASIDSSYRKPNIFAGIDLFLIDEAHDVPPDGEGMYRTLFRDLYDARPTIRVAGLTATPFRMKSGPICTSDSLLNEVCYEISVKKLMDDGYLSRVRSKAGEVCPDISSIRTSMGDFVASEVDEAFDVDDAVKSAVAETIAITEKRKSVLIFAASVKHAEHVQSEFLRMGVRAVCVFGSTSDEVRDEVVAKFKRGEIKYLINVQCFTTGFDAPSVDCVVLLRPTQSKGLYYQMVGRGFRLSPGKEDCIVLDYGRNVERHGPIDEIEPEAPKKKSVGLGSPPPAKVCPGCKAVLHTSVRTCVECGFVFPEPAAKHEPEASELGLLSGEKTKSSLKVWGTNYFYHEKRDDPDATPTLRVEYRTGQHEWKKEWVCIEHDGYAGKKARKWWSDRSNHPFPSSVEEAETIGRNGGVACPEEIVVEYTAGKDFPERITSWTIGEKPMFEEIEVSGKSIDDVADPFSAPVWSPSFDPHKIPLDELPF